MRWLGDRDARLGDSDGARLLALVAELDARGVSAEAALRAALRDL